MFMRAISTPRKWLSALRFPQVFGRKNLLLRGTNVAMYIVGQERRLVDPPSQVVAGVRTVTTQMDERCDAHVAALIPLFKAARLTASCICKLTVLRLKSKSQFDSRP